MTSLLRRAVPAGDAIVPAASVASVHRYALAVPDGTRRVLAARWLGLGLVALIASGVLSLLLVVSRTPGVQHVLPVADFFHVALVARRLVGARLVSRVRGRPVDAEQHAARPARRIARLRAGGRRDRCNCHRTVRRPRPSGDGELHSGSRRAAVPGRPRRVRDGRRRRRAPRDGNGAARAPAPCRCGCAPFRAQRIARGDGGRAARLRLVARGGSVVARCEGVLRAPVLGRRTRAAVHVDAADARRVAVARRRRRRARAAVAAGRDAAVRHRARVGVRHAADLPRLRRRFRRAPSAVHVADALRRGARQR